MLERKEICERVLNAEYAVRGELAIKAGEISDRLRKGEKFPFDRITYCNIGNPQQLGQKPISFYSKLLSLIENPALLSCKESQARFRPDLISRAGEISKKVGAFGAYTHSKGYQFVRENVAKFIEDRDGYPSDPEHIFLTDGASDGIKRTLGLLIEDKSSGILLPLPQYPLYSAAVTLLGGSIIFYALDEEKNWDLDMKDLMLKVVQAKNDGIRIKIMAIINPGNPTGNLLSYQTLAKVAKFCADENILILADEVYQSNIYGECQFVSMKKVVKDLKLDVPLISVHSTSKGFLGECSRRGGYMECCNISEEAISEVYKLASVNLCSNSVGQLVVDMLVDPPRDGDASYAEYSAEISAIKKSLERRMVSLSTALNELEGVHCSRPDGALYLFPSFKFPAKFIDEANVSKRDPDTLYCLKLLEATGICVVPGSGFGQLPGTYHIRLTCLPPEETFPHFINLFKTFHESFITQYS